jgi:hypothetical protein
MAQPPKLLHFLLRKVATTSVFESQFNLAAVLVFVTNFILMIVPSMATR